jgi:hypothetical protein
LRTLLRKLDRHAFSLQTAQLTRVRNYDDRYTVTFRHPRSAPSWTYVTQDIPADTDFSAPPTEVEGEGDGDVVERVERDE